MPGSGQQEVALIATRRAHHASVPGGNLKRLKTRHQTADQFVPLPGQGVVGYAQDLLFKGDVDRLAREEGNKNLLSLSSDFRGPSTATDS